MKTSILETLTQRVPFQGESDLLFGILSSKCNLFFNKLVRKYKIREKEKSKQCSVYSIQLAQLGILFKGRPKLGTSLAYFLLFIRQLSASGINILTARATNSYDYSISLKCIDIHRYRFISRLLKLAIINRVVFNQIDF